MCIHWPLANGELAHFTWSCVAILLLCGFFFLCLFAIVVHGESFVGYLCSTIFCPCFLAPAAVLPFWGYALFFMSVKKMYGKELKVKSQCKGRKNGKKKYMLKPWLMDAPRLEPFPQRPSSPQVCRRKWPFDPTSGYRPQTKNRERDVSWWFWWIGASWNGGCWEVLSWHFFRGSPLKILIGTENQPMKRNCLKAQD